MKTKTGKPRSRQVNIRLESGLESRVQKYRKQFRDETGVNIDFATAIRALVERSLNEKGL